MRDAATFAWPFFEDAHRTLAHELDRWAEESLGSMAPEGEVDARCRSLVAALGKAGWLRYAVAPQPGDGKDSFDTAASQIATHQDAAKKAASPSP